VITATARRIEGYKHEVEVDGHTVVVDEPADDGGTDAGPSPSRLLAASLASCTAITIAMYAGRREWDIEGLEVSVDFGGAPKGADTAHFTVNLTIPEGLDEEQVDKIRTIAAKCPVHRTLTGRIEIEIRDDSEGPAGESSG
jgi:putative redox protein